MPYWPINTVTTDGEPITDGGEYVTDGPPEYAPVWSGPFAEGVEPQTVYIWTVGPGASAASPGKARELTAAYGRVLTRRVAGHAYASFVIDGRHDEANEIVDLLSDLWIDALYPDGTQSLVFRGRVVGSQHTVTPDAHVRQVQAVDYRGMLTLAAGIEPTVPTYTGVDQASIAWQLVQHRQAQTGGNWGITQGVGTTSGQNRDLNTLLAGKPIGEAIDQLFARENGGEWAINPQLQLDRWFPRRGSNNGVVLDYGGLISTLQVGTAKFGNAGVATGSDKTIPAVSATGSVGTDERGRWTVSQGFPSVEDQGTVNAKAVWLRDEASTVRRQWTATMTPGRWRGDSHIGLGDVCRLYVDSGSLQHDGDVRVVEIQQVHGDDGTETVSLGLVEV